MNCQFIYSNFENCENKMRKEQTYHAISYFLLHILFLWGPNKSIAGKVGAHLLRRLPRQKDVTILGAIEVGPKKGRGISCDLWSLHQPACNFIGLNSGFESVSIG